MNYNLEGESAYLIDDNYENRLSYNLCIVLKVKKKVGNKEYAAKIFRKDMDDTSEFQC